MIQSAINRVAMEIEANPDDGIVLTDVGRHLPKKNGKRINYSTVWRWVTKGYAPATAGIVLATTLIGRCRYTSRQALRRFNRARNALDSHRQIIARNLRTAPANTTAKRYLAKEGFFPKHSAVSRQPSATESRTLNAEGSKQTKGLGHGQGTDARPGRLQSAVG